MKKSLLAAVALVVFVVPLLAYAQPRPSVRVNMRRMTLTRPRALQSGFTQVKNFKLLNFQSTGQVDDASFEWLRGTEQRMVGLRDNALQDGVPDSYGSQYTYQPDQLERGVLTSALKNTNVKVRQMVNTLHNIVYSYNVQPNYYMIVYDQGWKEMNKQGSPLVASTVRKCVPSNDYYADDTTFFFQIRGKTTANKVGAGSNHGYYKLYLDRNCSLKEIAFAPAGRVTANPNKAPRLDALYTLFTGSRFISPQLKTILENLAKSGFPNLH